MSIKLTKTSNEGLRDGRLTVLLCIISCFLLFDLSVAYNWFSSIGENDTKRKKQLKVTHSGLMVTNKSFVETRPESAISVPVEHTPFFFKPIPINLATKEMLMTVKGVGPSLAEKILDHRRKTGPFKNLEDLLTLKGIGRKRASHFKNSFTFDE